MRQVERVVVAIVRLSYAVVGEAFSKMEEREKQKNRISLPRECAMMVPKEQMLDGGEVWVEEVVVAA